MNQLKILSDTAKQMLDKMESGKEYTLNYIQKRCESAIDDYPHDQVIRAMAQVFDKLGARGKLTITQKQIYEVYNQFAGLRAESEARHVFSDLLYKKAADQIKRGNETEYSYRAPEQMLDVSVANNPLHSLFDTKQVVSYYDSSLAGIGKTYVEQELIKLKIPATSITVFAGNDAAIVYDVVFKNKLGTAHVAIPLQVEGGIHLPDVFVDNKQFIELTAENLNKYIVKVAKPEDVEFNVSNIGGVRTSSSMINQNFTFDKDAPQDIKLDPVKMPEALKDFASYDEALLDSSTGFPIETVRTAKAICAQELSGMGFSAQIKLSESSENCIICSAELDSSVGKVEIQLPVDIHYNRPQLPAMFYHKSAEDKIYEFNKEQLGKFLVAATADRTVIKRYANDISNMDYNQLKDEVIAGVAEKDYLRCETALNLIEDKFGTDQHKAAIADYAKFLKHASAPQKQHKCSMLITKGSIEPRCGHYNVPISRVIGDEDGNCVVADREAKYANLASSGAGMRTNKIILT